MTEDRKILIITGGFIEDDFMKNVVVKEKYKMIIAVDKGLHTADSYNLPLDFIVGDFDSVSGNVLKKYEASSIPIQRFPKEKDKTDTQLAIEMALNHDATKIDIVGATGSRMDHMLANIYLLLLPLRASVDACIIDGHNKIYLKDKDFSIEQSHQYGKFLSLLPLGEKVSGLVLKGVKYPLDHVELHVGSSLGISNEIKEKKAIIEFEEGILIVIESRD